MNYAKRLLNAFSSCLLSVIAVLALAAAPALAEGNWRIEGKNITEKIEFEGEKDSSTYGFLVPGMNIELVFETFTTENGTLSTNGEGTVKWLLTEGKVNTISPLVWAKNCEVGDLVFGLEMSLFLHEGKTYLYLQAPTGSPMTITTYGELCQLPETVEVTGSMVLEAVGGSFEEETVKHLVRQATASLFKGKEMKFGENAMSFAGTWWMKPAGKWSGLKWSGVG